MIGLSNGCVCCSVRDDFFLEQLNSMPLERKSAVVAEPQKAIRQCHYPGFYPQAQVVLVDKSHDKRLKDKYVGSLVAAQVERADLIVITKTDLNPSFVLDELKPIVTLSDDESFLTLLNWQGENDQIEETLERNNHGFFASLGSRGRNLSQCVGRLLGSPAGLCTESKGFCENVAGGVVQIRKFLEGEPIPTSLGLVFIGHDQKELPTVGPNPPRLSESG